MIPPNWVQHIRQSFPDNCIHKLNHIREIYKSTVSYGEEILARQHSTYLIQPDARFDEWHLVCAETGKVIRWGSYGWVKKETETHCFPILREIYL